MEIRVKNHLLSETVNFLFELKLDSGKQSRHRTRLVKKLNEHLEEVGEQQQELLKAHCNLDENGSPKTKEVDGVEKYDIKDENAFNEEWLELLNEELIIDGKNNQLTLKVVRQILDEYDGEKNGELSGRKAVLYEHLCEVFKVDEDIEEEMEDN